MIALAYTVLTLVMRSLPVTNNVSLLIAVSAPYAVLLAAFTFLGALLERQAVMAFVAAVVMTMSLGVQMNWYYGSQVKPPGDGVEIRLLSVNLRKGRADVDAVVNLARNVDVIALSELTPKWVRAFYDAGMRDVFPHSLLVPAPDPGGIGIWSKHPIDKVPDFKVRNMVAARAAVPGLPQGVVIAAVHVMNPLTFYGKSFDGWQSDIEAAQTGMDELAEKAGVAPVLVAGDFNSTPDIPQFRQLLRSSYRNAASQAGAGWSPTYPSRRWIPPLIAIDHVLTRNAAASSFRTVAIPGTDHRGLLATVVSPVTPH